MERIENIQGVDHIGYAVTNMDLAKEYFMALGFEFTENKEDELRNVNVSVGSMGRYDIKIELLSPIAGRKSPVDGYLQKLGSTPYHICYQVDDIDVSVEKLQNIGFTLLGFTAPSVPLGGDVVFLYSPEIGIVELIAYWNQL